MLILPLFARANIISLLISVFAYAIMAESWAIFGGSTKYSSLGHAAFFGVAMYVCCLLISYLPFALAVVCGGVISALMAFLLSFPFLRIRGPYFIIATYGLVEFFKAVFLYYEVNFTRTVGRVVAVRIGLNELYYFLFLVLGLTAIVYYMIKKSRLGFGLRGIKEDEDIAEAFGLNTAIYKTIGFSLSAFFAGICGGLLTSRWVYIDPYIAFSSVLSFESMLMALFGGATHIEGPILGSLVFTLIGDILRDVYPMYYVIFLGVILIVVVNYLPEGIIESIRKKISVKQKV